MTNLNANSGMMYISQNFQQGENKSGTEMTNVGLRATIIEDVFTKEDILTQ